MSEPVKTKRDELLEAQAVIEDEIKESLSKFYVETGLSIESINLGEWSPCHYSENGESVIGITYPDFEIKAVL